MAEKLNADLGAIYLIPFKRLLLLWSLSLSVRASASSVVVDMAQCMIFFGEDIIILRAVLASHVMVLRKHATAEQHRTS